MRMPSKPYCLLLTWMRLCLQRTFDTARVSRDVIIVIGWCWQSILSMSVGWIGGVERVLGRICAIIVVGSRKGILGFLIWLVIHIWSAHRTLLANMFIIAVLTAQVFSWRPRIPRVILPMKRDIFRKRLSRVVNLIILVMIPTLRLPIRRDDEIEIQLGGSECLE